LEHGDYKEYAEGISFHVIVGANFAEAKCHERAKLCVPWIIWRKPRFTSGRALRVLFHRQYLALANRRYSAQARQLNPDKSLLTNVSRDFFV
ncbi:hypothetical protein CXF72_00555, partial [Psychromonas sp. MB-3u-54]|uniref:hypothetical protein n=1 Tax=Psychromonas sp. MB-3u-54 TaxID=2058319 RepID=UPI000CBFF824